MGEETKAWAAPIKELLLEMKGEAERGGVGGRLPAERVEELTALYDRLVEEGLRAEPPPDVPDPVKNRRAACFCGCGGGGERCCSS